MEFYSSVFSGSSTSQREKFQEETYRVISGTYANQAAVTNASNVWDSEVFMTASNGGHTNGLQFFSSSLLSPTNTLLSGDFRKYCGRRKHPVCACRKPKLFRCLRSAHVLSSFQERNWSNTVYRKDSSQR